MHQLSFPGGTVFTGHPGDNQGKVRIALIVTYKGQSSDPSAYFYKTIFSIRRTQNPGTMNKTVGGVVVEATDEGIVGDINELFN